MNYILTKWKFINKRKTQNIIKWKLYARTKYKFVNKYKIQTLTLIKCNLHTNKI